MQRSPSMSWLIKTVVVPCRKSLVAHRNAGLVVLRQNRREVEIQHLVYRPTNLLSVGGVLEADETPEIAQRGVAISDDLCVDVIHRLAECLHLALEITTRERLVAKHLALVRDDDLVVRGRVCCDPLLSHLVTHGEFLLLPQRLDDLVLVLLEEGLADRICADNRRDALRANVVGPDDTGN